MKLSSHPIFLLASPPDFYFDTRLEVYLLINRTIPSHLWGSSQTERVWRPVIWLAISYLFCQHCWHFYLRCIDGIDWLNIAGTRIQTSSIHLGEFKKGGLTVCLVNFTAVWNRIWQTQRSMGSVLGTPIIFERTPPCKFNYRDTCSLSGVRIVSVASTLDLFYSAMKLCV